MTSKSILTDDYQGHLQEPLDLPLGTCDYQPKVRLLHLTSDLRYLFFLGTKEKR